MPPGNLRDSADYGVGKLHIIRVEMILVVKR